MKKILLVCFILLSACGYTPIYLNKNFELLKFSKVNFSGNENINNRLINVLKIEESSSDYKYEELFLNSNYKVISTSKDSKGIINSYRSTIDVQILIKDKNKIEKNKTFSQSFNYNNIENKIDLFEYQNEIKINLIDKIIEDIILFFNI